MNCPHCSHDNSRVIETRKEGGETWRRRKCDGCQGTFFSCEYSQKDMKFPAEIMRKSMARLREKGRAAHRLIHPASSAPVTLDWVHRRYATDLEMQNE